MQANQRNVWKTGEVTKGKKKKDYIPREKGQSQNLTTQILFCIGSGISTSLW